MYVHPQEIDYTIDTLFDLIDASGLDFIGFSNPSVWQLESLLGKQPELIERASHLSERQRYRLIELLNPEAITHYEFFLGRPPLPKTDWSSDPDLLQAIPERNPCMEGWPSPCLFNDDYQVVNLSQEEFSFLQACDSSAPAQTVQALLTDHPLDLQQVRRLWQQRLIILAPGLR
jgi:hypothetical protein